MRVVMMQTFARYITLFQEHARLNTVSAYAMYQDLRRLVAEFSVFSEDIGYFGELANKPRETELPDYDHEDLRRCFRIGFDRDRLPSDLTLATGQAGTTPMTLRFRPISAAALIAPNTLAAPVMSNFISSMPGGCLSEMPPLSLRMLG